LEENAMHQGSNTLARVRDALIASGYDPEGITSAEYRGQSDHGHEIHDITFADSETGEQTRGRVYIAGSETDHQKP